MRYRRIEIFERHLQGEPDVDRSIMIPLDHSIERSIGEGIALSEVSKPYRDYGTTTICVGSNFYMLWIEERNEWVGIRNEQLSRHFEGDYWGEEEKRFTDGPYRLNEECAKLILQSYDNHDIPINRALSTSPIDLERRSRNLNPPTTFG
jgi:hypothetical protein